MVHEVVGCSDCSSRGAVRRSRFLCAALYVSTQAHKALIIPQQNPGRASGVKCLAPEFTSFRSEGRGRRYEHSLDSPYICAFNGAEHSSIFACFLLYIFAYLKACSKIRKVDG